MSKVLIIDDEKDILDLIESLLEMELGIEVIKASDGAEGIQNIQQFSDIDLIICDVNMPERGGREVFLENLASKNLPFIIMTGSDELEVSFTEKFTNANPYNRILPKPWKPKEFLSVVKNIVEDKISVG
ncbi:MAG: hypothetical protein CME65_06155 [Halobacteriovoraceae bacterium]|nr:hypothetical protein [Halobacteriovoraceae bacterium]|tara:strand:+ start:6334 stop:6720 length:387 start_codon:yes stop_codon:yes gene_type:complete